MKKNINYIFYGIESDPQEVRTFIVHMLSNVQQENSTKKTPLCIWGTHGIGKTEIVSNIAKELNWDFAYIAPAQFEEMGDLIGMPIIENGQTVFKAPDWVPTSDGPGILLIDDVNRADDRILRGIMQLLQNYELISWKLPPKWQIILTANPDGGDYSVTPMDDAMLTRMMHITMLFDVKIWALWAERNNIDPRGINFVLTYPEVCHGRRSTPRSLVQFFDSIKNIPNLKQELALVNLLASSCLDKETVSAFIAYVQQNLSDLIKPSEIYNAKDFRLQVYAPIKNIVVSNVFRVDIMATICTRLINNVTAYDVKLNSDQIKNIQQFIKMDFIPNDLRLSVLQDLVQSNNTSLKMVMADAEISLMLLNRLK